MRGLYFDGNQLRYREDLPQPVLPAGEALVAVQAAGICRTDQEILAGYMRFHGIPGHEFIGTVMSTSEPELMGKRVVGEINCPCGGCELCRLGLQAHCRDRTVLGVAQRDGAFAEYLALPAANLHPVPDSLRTFQGCYPGTHAPPDRCDRPHGPEFSAGGRPGRLGLCRPPRRT